jgi:Flp pilus assembly protein TadG
MQGSVQSGLPRVISTFVPGSYEELPPVASDRRSRQRGQSIVEFALVLPIMLILLLAILDLARVYTTMMSVESAAREAADYGTTLGAGKWQDGAPAAATASEMERRACVAASNLADYEDPDADPQTGGCTNPAFAYCVIASVGGPCGPLDPAAGCEVPTRTTPCSVTVTLTHDFHLLAPIGIDFFGVRLGLPASLPFQRDSTFAITDIGVAP